MVRRSTPQHKIDDLAFPVRVKFKVPPNGLMHIGDRLRAWLAREIPPGDYAWHSSQSTAADATAVYFRTVGDANRFTSAFPEFELADGTMSVAYRSPIFPRGRRVEN